MCLPTFARSPPPLISQHTDHCSACAGALKNAIKATKFCKATVFTLVALLPTLVARRSVRATIALTIFGLVVGRAWMFANYVERALTSGVHFYPPPRNLPDKKGASKNLKTVEQGRKY